MSSPVFGAVAAGVSRAVEPGILTGGRNLQDAQPLRSLNTSSNEAMACRSGGTPSSTSGETPDATQDGYVPPGLSKSRLLGLGFSALIAITAPIARSQDAAPVPKQGAELLKTDIMGVFAHPDDETGMAATLAQYARGHHAIIANVYCTRGEGGGNMVGTQEGSALGILREAELRDCLSQLGVRYCYFLDRLDWAYTESVAATLQKWGKEETLGRLVRLVRELRPDVMVTMNPAPTPGQHGHHQAAGLLATEAFSAAADPARFPEQLHKEGLTVWQPRKLYFAGNTGGVVCAVKVDQALPDGQTPAQIAGQALANHRSQAFGNFRNASWLQRPQSFALIKSFIAPAENEQDLLRGLPASDAELKPVTVGAPAIQPPLELAFVPRPAFANYCRWVQEQHVEHAGQLFRADLPFVVGDPNEATLTLANNSDTPSEGILKLDVPAQWRVEPASQPVRAGARSIASVRFRITPPASTRNDTEITAAYTQGSEVGRASASVHPLPRTGVVRLQKAPSLDGIERGWEDVPVLHITSGDLVEGKVANEADSSAEFRLAHDGQTLFVDVRVRDDVVVTNIAPNDIRGHWRSDSVEICIDPVGGAEHTLGCFKLGIFPFDTTGVVRAARDADANQGLVEETAPSVRLYSQRTSDGYRVDAALPFRELGVSYPKTRRIGFNLIIYDGDKAGAALGENINKSRIAWAPRPGVQGRPEDWGRLELQ
jgi:LmbE family N-acetylglucosaminyl deacetylase